MEKNFETTDKIKTTIEELIVDNFNEKSGEIAFSKEDSLSERLDSMAICLLIVRLEEIYNIEFPLESFCKNDSSSTLANKVHEVIQRKNKE